jgi:hypothetical protein
MLFQAGIGMIASMFTMGVPSDTAPPGILLAKRSDRGNGVVVGERGCPHRPDHPHALVHGCSSLTGLVQEDCLTMTAVSTSA